MPADLKSLPRRAAGALVRFAIRLPWLVIVLSLALTALALRYTQTHISIDTDTENMIDARLPHRQANIAFDKAFPRLPGGVVLYTESLHAGDAEDAADAITAALRQRPDISHAVSQPDGGEFFARQGLLYLTVDELWGLDDRLAQAGPMLGALAHDPSLRGLFETLELGLTNATDPDQQANLATLLQRVESALARHAAGSAEPIRWRDELFTRAGSTPLARSFVLIDPALAATSFQPTQPAIDALHALVAEMAPRFPGVTIQITGSDAMDGEELVTVGDDATLTTSLSFVLVALVLIWGLRSTSLVLAVLVTLACGLIWTAAFAAMFVGSLNLISVCFAVLFIGMGVDFGIQFVLRYQEESKGTALRNAALERAGEGVGGALLLAAVGAAISFSAFVPTSYRGLAQLGIISSCSMAIALIANLSLLPALLSCLPVPTARKPQVHSSHTLSNFVVRYRYLILGVSVLAAAVSVALVPQARFDLNPLNLKDPHSAAVIAFKRLAADADSSPYTIHVLADSLASADAVAARLSAQPTVDKAVTLSSYVAQSQPEKLEIIDGMKLSLGDLMAASSSASPSLAEEQKAIEHFAGTLSTAEISDPALKTVAQRLVSQLAALRSGVEWPDKTVPAVRAMLLGDLPRTLDRLRGLLEAEAFTAEDLPPDIHQRYIAADGRARVEVFPKEDLNDNSAMRRFAADVQAAEPTATGAPVELVAGSAAVIDSCIKASLLALALTLLMHIVVLHGLVDALLVSAPLVLAMLLTVATSVIFSFPFNFANIIALPLLIGLNNAYGAYLVVRRQHAGGIDNLLNSNTPRAVMFSGLTAIASFGTLAASKHPGMAGMGILISLSLTYALLCALLMLPALMVVVEGCRRR